MFTVYIILAAIVGLVLGIVIGDIKHSIISSYLGAKDKEVRASIEGLIKDFTTLKDNEMKNISAAENKDAANIKSDVNNITPPKI